jgi:hypothetical protein
MWHMMVRPGPMNATMLTADEPVWQEVTPRLDGDQRLICLLCSTMSDHDA